MSGTDARRRGYVYFASDTFLRFKLWVDIPEDLTPPSIYSLDWLRPIYGLARVGEGCVFFPTGVVDTDEQF